MRTFLISLLFGGLGLGVLGGCEHHGYSHHYYYYDDGHPYYYYDHDSRYYYRDGHRYYYRDGERHEDWEHHDRDRDAHEGHHH